MRTQTLSSSYEIKSTILTFNESQPKIKGCQDNYYSLKKKKSVSAILLRMEHEIKAGKEEMLTSGIGYFSYVKFSKTVQLWYPQCPTTKNQNKLTKQKTKARPKTCHIVRSIIYIIIIVIILSIWTKYLLTGYFLVYFMCNQ